MKYFLKILSVIIGAFIGGLAVYAFTSDDLRWNNRTLQLALTSQVLFMSAAMIQLGQKRQENASGNLS